MPLELMLIYLKQRLKFKYSLKKQIVTCVSRISFIFFFFLTGRNTGIEFLDMCQIQILCSVFLKISHVGKQSYLYRMSKTALQ